LTELARKKAALLKGGFFAFLKRLFLPQPKRRARHDDVAPKPVLAGCPELPGFADCEQKKG